MLYPVTPLRDSASRTVVFYEVETGVEAMRVYLIMTFLLRLD